MPDTPPLSDPPFDFSILKLPYEPGEWRDADYRMFEACFAILGQFVEDELQRSTPEDVEHNSDYRGYRLHSCGGHDEKAIDLWLWYRDELPKLEEDYVQDIRQAYGDRLTFNDDGSVTHNGSGKLKYQYDFPEQVKDEKLRELIALRRSLWT